MSETILVFDIGLTNCKTVLFDPCGTILSSVSIPYPTKNPQPGWVEQDPTDWMIAIGKGVELVKRQNPIAYQSVGAISVTGHMHTLVSLGEDEHSQYPALILGDQRSMIEAEAITNQYGLSNLYQLTGARMDASMPLAKICWLQTHQSINCKQAHVFLACKDWVRHQLTGDLLTDPLDACGTALYNLGTRQWSSDLVGLAGIRLSQLPRIADPCSIAGFLLPGAARYLDLKPGIPVVVGAGDDVEVLGNGLVAEGSAMEHLGTTGSILTCTQRLLYDPQMALEIYPHVIPGLWVLGGSVTAAGSALGWVDQILNHPQERPFLPCSGNPRLDQPLIFIPHLSGERCPTWEPRARGSWIGLCASHTVQDLYQAAFEGILFSLKQVLESIEALCGEQKRITITGNDDRDHDQIALRTQIYNRQLSTLKTKEPTALGAMMLAAVGVGIYPDIPTAVTQCHELAFTINPDPFLAQQYSHLYRYFLASTEILHQLIHLEMDLNPIR